MAKDKSPANLTMSQESELNAKAQADETFEQKMSFETYYKMGDNRSLAKVAKKTGRGLTTLEDWSSKLRWSARVKERERQAAEYLLMQQSAQEEAEQKQKHLTLIDASIAQWSKKLVDGSIVLKSVDDLKKLVELRWQIAQIKERTVNVAGVGHGASIDLRLRGMKREELQQFLYSTLKSIERVMNKPKPGVKTGDKQVERAIDMAIKVEATAEADSEQTREMKIVSPKNPVLPDVSIEPDEILSVEDLDLDISDSISIE